MTDLDIFVADAIKTESTVETIRANEKLLTETISILISAGNILDQIKKNAFYDKPYNTEILTSHIEHMNNSIRQLNNAGAKNIVDDKKDFAVNPRIFHSIIGIATESTELLEALDLYSEELDTINMAEEFGDIDWYKAIGSDEIGISFATILTTVISKLKTRFPNAYTNEDAIERNLDDEREVLETMEAK